MATHPPLTVALSVIPSLPRPLLCRLVERAIERLDEVEPDPDFEPDDFAEDDDPAEYEDAGGCGSYGIDQREMQHLGGAWRDL